jgi:hypothetical protein
VWFIKTDEYGTPLWNRTYGEANPYERASSVIQTRDGGYMIAGRNAELSRHNAWLIKTTNSGEVETTQILRGDKNQEPTCIIQTADGGYAVTVFIAEVDVGLIKLDSESGLAWTDSTPNTLALYRGNTDPYWNFVRIRIWKIRE